MFQIISTKYLELSKLAQTKFIKKKVNDGTHVKLFLKKKTMYFLLSKNLINVKENEEKSEKLKSNQCL